MTPAQELRAAMDRAGLSVQDVATLIGRTRRTVYNWLEGKTDVPAVVLDQVLAEEQQRVSAWFVRETGAPPYHDAEALLAFMAQEQQRRVATLEAELVAERAALAATRRRIRQAAAADAIRPGEPCPDPASMRDAEGPENAR